MADGCTMTRKLSRLLLSIMFFGIFGGPAVMGQPSDSDRLGMALDYFQSGKYHEAMLLLRKLDRQYRLNPRFRAYLGVCYFYDWEYRQAAECLEAALPQLTAFAPQERAFYYYAAAESRFQLKEYARALPLFNTMLTLCKDNEKPDAFYRIALIYSMKAEWIKALDYFQTALVFYRKYRPDATARIAQIRHQIIGCCAAIDEERMKK